MDDSLKGVSAKVSRFTNIMVIICVAFITIFWFALQELKKKESQLTGYGTIADTAVITALQKLPASENIVVGNTASGVQFLVKENSLKLSQLAQNGCSDGQTIIWNGALSKWACSIPTVTATSIDWKNVINKPAAFSGTDFTGTLTESQVEEYITNGAINLFSGSKVNSELIATRDWVNAQGFLTVAGTQLTEAQVENYITNGAIALATGSKVGSDLIATRTWVNSQGFITTQLTEGQVETYITNGAINLATGSTVNSEPIATQNWVNTQGFLTSQLSEAQVENYITNGSISLATGSKVGADLIATQTWVNSRGFITSQLTEAQVENYITNAAIALSSGSTIGTDLIATQTWVNAQGFITSQLSEAQVENYITNAAIALATGSKVGSEFIATQNWVVAQGYLTAQLTEGQVENYITNGAINLATGTTLNAEAIATQNWVNSRGFITSQLTEAQVENYVTNASINLATGSTVNSELIATQNWVTAQGFTQLTEGQIENYITNAPIALATGSMVGADQIATQTWVNAQGFLTSMAAGAFTQNGNSFSANAVLGTSDNYALQFKTNNNVAMTIATNGKVGIGTTSPNATLDVNGSVNIGSNLAGATGTYAFVVNDANAGIYLNRIGTGANEPFIRFTNSTAGSGFQLRGNDAGGLRFTDASSVTEWLRVTSAGKVGIGTNSPTELLQVNGNIRIANATPKITVDNAIGNHLFTLARNDSVATADLAISAYGGIGFAGGKTTGPETGNGYQLYLASNGNVGVGTTAPAHKLSVMGSGYFLGDGSVPNAPADLGFYLGKSQTDENRRLEIVGPSNGVTYIDFTQPNSDYQGRILYSNVSNQFDFYTNTTAKMSITSAGNVGIGTTTPHHTMQVEGTLKVGGAADQGTGNIALGDDQTTAMNVGMYRGTISGGIGAGNVLNLAGYSGITLTTGAAGFGSQTAAMTITNAQKVGIGTTAPNAKLHVKTASGSSDIINEASAAGGAAWLWFSHPTGNDVPGGMGFWSSGAGYGLVINSTGNVGLGTISPGAKLDVKGAMRLSGSSSGYVGLVAAANAGSTTYTLPTADGSNGQVLKTDGAGNLSWTTVSTGGGSPLVGTPISSTYHSTRPTYMAFDGVTDGYDAGWVTNATTSGYIGYRFTAPSIVVSYTIYPYNYNGIARNPKDWVFEASNDGVTWTTLDTRTNQTSWTIGTGNNYTFTNTTNYTWYRVNFSTNNGDAYSGVAELAFTQAATVNLWAANGSSISYVGGNVGIGMNTPSQALEVNGNVKANNVIAAKIYPSTDSTTAFQILKANGTTSVFTADTTNNINKLTNLFTIISNVADTHTLYIMPDSTISFSAANWGDNIGFSTIASDGTYHTNQLYLGSNGNVGIGGTTVNHMLDVNGNIGILASGYLNFGTTDGLNGYGIRDNSGTIEFKNSGGSWQPISSSSAAWSPDTPPSTPNAMDDEFSGATLDPKWTIYTDVPAGSYDISTANGALKLQYTSMNANTYRSISVMQPISGSGWKFRTKVTLEGNIWNYTGAGILVRNSTVDKSHYFVLLKHSSLGDGLTGYYGRMNGFTVVSEIDLANSWMQTYYLQVEFDGTNMIYSFSTTGINYQKVLTEPVATHLSAAPNYVGVILHPYNTLSGYYQPTATVDWFRRIN